LAPCAGRQTAKNVAVSDLLRTPESSDGDPEELIAGYRWRFDPDTLREVLDPADTALFERIRAGLGDKAAAAGDDAVRARLLSLRASVARILLDLDGALADGRRALDYAEAAGNPRLLAGVQIRLGHVHQWRCEFEPAERLFAAALAADLPDPARATVEQHAGKFRYDQGRYAEARDHFARALELRRDQPDSDPDLVVSSEIALAAARRRALMI
jgi:tetratricopeptide (TPR) repeat protein